MADHEHHHHHHHEEDGREIHGIGISSHEGALIGTLSGHMPAQSVDLAKEQLSAALIALAALIREAGGIIGHIKAIVSEEGRGYQISVTDEQAAVRSLPVSAYRADCAAIVFALSENELRAFLEKTLGALIVPLEDDDCCGGD